MDSLQKAVRDTDNSSCSQHQFQILNANVPKSPKSKVLNITITMMTIQKLKPSKINFLTLQATQLGKGKEVIQERNQIPEESKHPSPNEGKHSHSTFVFLGLGYLTQNNFRLHPFTREFHHFFSLNSWIQFHCVHVPHFHYPFIS